MIDTIARRKPHLVTLLVIVIVILPVSSFATQPTLTVFTTTGLDKPLEELADLYSKNSNIKIKLVTGEINNDQLKHIHKSADIIITGAEYQLNHLISMHPDLLDESTRTSLLPRTAGVLVRKGSNKKIVSFSDLGKNGTNLLVVDADDQTGLWEDMAAKRETIGKIRNNILVSAKSNSDAVKQWKIRKDLDAWITFQSWHYYTKDSTRLIKVLDHYKRFRGTPLAITNSSANKLEAKKFIEFLKLKSSLAIYQRWGW